MIFRSLALAGLGAFLLSGTPASAASDTPVKNVDAVKTDALDANPDALKKPKAKAKKASISKKRKKEREEQPVVEEASYLNNGELRSEKDARPSFLSIIFGGDKPQLLPQTQTLDHMLAEREQHKPFKVKPAFEPQEVPFSGYPKGTIVINTKEKFLYLVDSADTARRYAIAVGREGLQFKGTGQVGDKQEWPRWIPTLDMQKREPKEYGRYKDGMPGGPNNPLGARAIYVYQGKKDTHIRIHGTNQPWTIGTSASNGCFRMINEHVMDLYRRVKVGEPVVVL